MLYDLSDPYFISSFETTCFSFLCARAPWTPLTSFTVHCNKHRTSWAWPISFCIHNAYGTLISFCISQKVAKINAINQDLQQWIDRNWTAEDILHKKCQIIMSVTVLYSLFHNSIPEMGQQQHNWSQWNQLLGLVLTLLWFSGGINPCSFSGIKLWSSLCERRVKSLGQAAAAGLKGIEFGNQ